MELAKSQLFEYAVLWHPTEKEAKEGKKSKVLVEPSQVLEKDARVVGMKANMKIPAEYADQLEQIEICVRPF